MKATVEGKFKFTIGLSALSQDEMEIWNTLRSDHDSDEVCTLDWLDHWLWRANSCGHGPVQLEEVAATVLIHKEIQDQ